MKKILIFLEESKLLPCGGPYGYNYNLKDGLNNVNSELKIDYIYNDLEKGNKYSNKIMNAFYKKINFFNCYKSDEISNKFEDYDCIHFHTSKHLFKARKLLEDYKGKVLFTSHSPMLLSTEMKQDASILSRIIFFWYYLKLKKMDSYAFRKADYLIFPCKEAEDPYKNWSEFEYVKGKKKFKYIPTGIVDVRDKIKESREVYRKRYNIPEEAYVISYVGRHNKVKGYKLLKQFGKKVMQDNKNVYFLIGGKEYPIKGIDNKQWIEVGFTKDPYSLINASDVFILPNLETYFDLVMLEVISIGKTVLASYTGGNKYFSKFGNIGIKLFKNIDEMIKINNNLIELPNYKLSELGNQNRKLFEMEFESKIFAENYIKLIQEILNE